jgi:hypothetical protein
MAINFTKNVNESHTKKRKTSDNDTCNAGRRQMRRRFSRASHLKEFSEKEQVNDHNFCTTVSERSDITESNLPGQYLSKCYESKIFHVIIKLC